MKKMKSLALTGAICAIIGMATSASAVLSIDWSNGSGYFGNEDNDLGAGEVTPNGGIYAMLILLNPGQTVGAPATGDLTGGGTVLLDADLAALADAANRPYGGATVITTPQSPWIDGSSVFARIFQADDAVGASAAGTWYYDGPVALVLDKNLSGTPPDLNQLYEANVNSAGSFGGAFGGDALATGQVIPEPTTLALLGLGMLTAIWRRRG